MVLSTGILMTVQFCPVIDESSLAQLDRSVGNHKAIQPIGSSVKDLIDYPGNRGTVKTLADKSVTWRVR